MQLNLTGPLPKLMKVKLPLTLLTRVLADFINWFPVAGTIVYTNEGSCPRSESQKSQEEIIGVSQGTSEESGFQRKMSETEKFELIEFNSNG